LKQRKHIRVTGIVQGVGFRPFVYRLAVLLNLKGFVANSSSGVDIQIEGEMDAIGRFLERIRLEAPVQSRIAGIDVADVPLQNDFEFSIRSSRADTSRLALISPDIGICDDCLRELFDPHDRRYRYPFINCTNCGPRYTILKEIPYDRPNTTMAVFLLCPDCLREYQDPSNRRFHAQPNACPVCGPKVWLTDRAGTTIDTEDPVRETIRRLKNGAVAAIKGIGGFHLACDATREDAVRLLREKKSREEKPLAVMVKDVSVLREVVQWTVLERDILQSPRRPIVLLPKRHPNPLAESVAPRNGYFGILLAYSPLHRLLFDGDRSGRTGNGIQFLVMTSGNLSEEPISVGNEEALKRLGGIADCFLMHDRDIFIRNDDSVVLVAAGLPRTVRRSRGYAPEPIFLRKSGPPVLAVGGELKNAVCLTQGDRAFLSQHIGDLENEETLDGFEKTIRHLERILRIRAEILAHDLHPDYLSTRWALEQRGFRFVPVQHHHAHIASCLAENGREDRVIGFSLDGTGYGSDGQIWGGEILLADLGRFERTAHLSSFPLAGADRAVREPWRSAVGVLYSVWENRWKQPPEADAFLEWIQSCPLVPAAGEKEVRTVIEMIRANFNTVQTSSLGRLFDAVSALAGVCVRSAFEGQAAMELEMAMETVRARPDCAYTFTIREDSGTWLIESDSMIPELLQDVRTNAGSALISLKFHRALVHSFVRVAEKVREQSGIETAALSGGCFQNRFLLEQLTAALVQAGFEVLNHSMVPPNDGGLALGQAAIASNLLSSGSVDLS